MPPDCPILAVMAQSANAAVQRMVAILRGPTGGMLACLLTASLMGGVAAAHPGTWAGRSAGDKETADASSAAASHVAEAATGTSCAVVLLGLTSADDVHGLTTAIQAVRTNCEGEPEAPGLIVALRHLRASLEHGGRVTSRGEQHGGAAGEIGGSGAGSNAGAGPRPGGNGSSGHSGSNHAENPTVPGSNGQTGSGGSGHAESGHGGSGSNGQTGSGGGQTGASGESGSSGSGGGGGSGSSGGQAGSGSGGGNDGSGSGGATGRGGGQTGTNKGGGDNHH